MAMGIDKYNAECRSIVMRYSSEWRTTVERMGRWIDFDNDYKTLNITFMESVWWAFGELFKKGMVYRGLRVMPYSTGLTTPLSNFEAGLDYRDVNDPAGSCVFSCILFFYNTSLQSQFRSPWSMIQKRHFLPGQQHLGPYLLTLLYVFIPSSPISKSTTRKKTKTLSCTKIYSRLFTRIQRKPSSRKLVSSRVLI